MALALAPTQPRAAIYCRVSSTTQEENASLPTQEERALVYAVAHGYDVVNVYRDTHSGLELYTRPRLTELRQAIRRGSFDVVIAFGLDRLSRDQNHIGLLDEEFQ